MVFKWLRTKEEKNLWRAVEELKAKVWGLEYRIQNLQQRNYREKYKAEEALESDPNYKFFFGADNTPKSINDDDS